MAGTCFDHVTGSGRHQLAVRGAKREPAQAQTRERKDAVCVCHRLARPAHPWPAQHHQRPGFGSSRAAEHEAAQAAPLTFERQHERSRIRNGSVDFQRAEAGCLGKQRPGPRPQVRQHEATVLIRARLNHQPVALELGPSDDQGIRQGRAAAILHHSDQVDRWVQFSLRRHSCIDRRIAYWLRFSASEPARGQKKEYRHSEDGTTPLFVSACGAHQSVLMVRPLGETMPAQCAICGKQRRVANNVSHSNIKTKSQQRPNLQNVHITVGGSRKRVRVCTRCIRSGFVGKAP